jgi:hypothetical protein
MVVVMNHSIEQNLKDYSLQITGVIFAIRGSNMESKAGG